MIRQSSGSSDGQSLTAGLVQDEIRHILTCGLDGLEYAEKAFRELTEKASKVSQLASKLDTAALRAKMHQMFTNASEREAQLLEEMNKDLEDAKKDLEDAKKHLPKK